MIFYFTKYTPAGASSRYRTYQYLPALQAAGFAGNVLPLFDDAYLAHKYAQGTAKITQVLRAFLCRLWWVLRVPRGATVWIEYELFPYCPAIFERWLAWRGCHMIVDYDDALFHQYDAHPRRVVRMLLGRKIATVMRLAHVVVAGNAYLAAYAKAAGAASVVTIPTVIDAEKYPQKAPTPATERCVIGWVGSPSTAKYLQAVAPALAEVARRHDIIVRLIGSGQVTLANVPVTCVPWHEASEVSDILSLDIGIMPLPDEPWARGKCGFKLIQYMGCALPVVASPVGVNTELVQPDNGYLATTQSEWVSALEALIADVGLRHRLGAAGRARVDRAFTRSVTTPLLKAAFRQAACT